jgi:hypothetical protein
MSEESEDKDEMLQDSQSPDRDLNQRRLKHEVGFSVIAGMISSSTA